MRISAVIDGNTQIIHGILGSISTSNLINRINEKLKSSINMNFKNIEEIINKGREIFINQIIQPQLKIKNKINNILSKINNDKIKHEYRPLFNDDDFRNIPLCMYEPILTYRPIRKLLQEDKIYGFGIDKNVIRNDDVYARLIHNGTCRYIEDKVLNNKEINCISIWKDSDPELSLEDIEAIEITRLKIDELLEKGIDPTDYPNKIYK